ncbi:MAG: hypothetical protein DHS20C16_10900 [Phycisphaerae bacterium]|nr:MAG: hypothetical protein DHS20C16_10900 [Phycisphaerae bacterium]
MTLRIVLLLAVAMVAGCEPEVVEPGPGDDPTPATGIAKMDLAVTATDAGVLTRVYGSSGDGRRGLPVAGGFDCDGDGFVDTGFASIQASPLDRQGAGEVLLVFGDGTIGGDLDTFGFSERVLKIAGAAELEVTGAEIWMDDVNNDGTGDLLICRQNFSPTEDRRGAGALSIIFGSSALREHAESQTYLDFANPPDNISILTFVGVAAFDRLGIWTRTGDVTGDGIVDIIVGADEANQGEEANAGEAYLIRGGAHLTGMQTIDLANFGATELAGNILKILPPPAARNYHLGATCNIADLDGNGRGDVLLAAALTRAGAGIRVSGALPGTGAAIGGAPNGSLYIVWDDNFASGAWSVGETITIDEGSESVTTIRGAEENGAFGEEIVGGLDYNGDGFADLFLGDLVADGINGNSAGRGYIFDRAKTLRGLDFVINAPPESVKVTLIEGPTRDSLGGDTLAHGDFNKDGIADLAVGSPHGNPQDRLSAGVVHVLIGQTKGWPDVIDLAQIEAADSGVDAVSIVEGAFGSATRDAGDTLCYSAAAADLDGDGYTDLIVNEMAGNGLADDTVDVGNMLLISGAALSDFPQDDAS